MNYNEDIDTVLATHIARKFTVDFWTPFDEFSQKTLSEILSGGGLNLTRVIRYGKHSRCTRSRDGYVMSLYFDESDHQPFLEMPIVAEYKVARYFKAQLGGQIMQWYFIRHRIMSSAIVVDIWRRDNR